MHLTHFAAMSSASPVTRSVNRSSAANVSDWDESDSMDFSDLALKWFHYDEHSISAVYSSELCILQGCLLVVKILPWGGGAQETHKLKAPMESIQMIN